MSSQSLPVTADKTASKHSSSSATCMTSADRIVDAAKLVAVLLVIGCVAYHVNPHHPSNTGKRVSNLPNFRGLFKPVSGFNRQCV